MGGLSRLAAREHDYDVCALLDAKVRRRKETELAQLERCRGYQVDPPRRPQPRLPPLEWSRKGVMSPKISQLADVSVVKQAQPTAEEELEAQKTKMLTSEGVISTWMAARGAPTDDFEREFERIEDTRQKRSWEEAAKADRQREEERRHIKKHGKPPPKPVRTTKYSCAMATPIYAQMAIESEQLGMLQYKDTIDVTLEQDEWMRCERGWVRMYNPRLKSVKHFKKVFIPNDDEMASRVLLSGLDSITTRVSDLIKAVRE
eukprot:TRINITY_DN6500_c0_g1_i1.p1 TRINITY_DN6500_c0_g1~~TRINITY_DN6500_c0_g1_i1.p1  ORF type:complete len:260 (+),score=107.18 TRINITY_DN6500_c0_g1_i1:80-859(+)